MRRQFLIEAAILSGAGGAIGVIVAAVVGGVAALLAPGFPATPPLWAITSGLMSAVGVGLTAGYLPARRAAALDPVEALRDE